MNNSTSPVQDLGYLMAEVERPSFYLSIDRAAEEVAAKEGVPMGLGPFYLAILGSMSSEHMPHEMAYAKGSHAYAIWKFRQSRSRAVFVLDDRCAAALMSTSIPEKSITREAMTSAYRLPYSSFALVVPGVGVVVVTQSCFPAEAEWETDSTRPRPGRPWSDYEKDPVIVLYIVSNHGPFGTDGLVSTLCPGRPTDLADNLASNIQFEARFDEPRKRLRLISVAERAVLNFLLALNTGHLQQKVGQLPTTQNPKKRRRLERDGIVLHQHTVISLQRPQRGLGKKSEESDPGVRAHFVRGHWHSYWVSKPAGRPILGTKQHSKTDTLLYRVVYWIHPHIRGDGTHVDPSYRMKQ